MLSHWLVTQQLDVWWIRSLTFAGNTNCWRIARWHNRDAYSVLRTWWAFSKVLSTSWKPRSTTSRRWAMIWSRRPKTVVVWRDESVVHHPRRWSPDSWTINSMSLHITHTIHGTGIFTYMWHKFTLDERMGNVWKYINLLNLLACMVSDCIYLRWMANALW